MWNRSKVAHKPGIDEQPTLFHRIPDIEGAFKPCRRCFHLEPDAESSSEGSSSLEDVSSNDEDST